MTRIITKQLHILSRNTPTIEHCQSEIRISATSRYGGGGHGTGETGLLPIPPVMICIRKCILNCNFSAITKKSMLRNDCK